jgi:hypothetical protein
MLKAQIKQKVFLFIAEASLERSALTSSHRRDFPSQAVGQGCADAARAIEV